MQLGAADPRHVLREDDAYVWGGGAIPGPDGRYYHVYARWARAHTFNAWTTHSELGYAIGDTPFGPWEIQGPLLQRRAAWDQVLHNPDLQCFDGRYYLYYTANHGNGEHWDHRNHQRVGVAVADHPAGPWQRMDAPIIDAEPGTPDHLLTAHPNCTRGPDGTYYLIYKGVSEGPLPFGGKVRWRVATADHPTGPFRKHPEVLFDHPTAKFPADDSYIWQQDGRFYAVVKDQGGYYADYGEGKALLLFQSGDGLRYEPVAEPMLSRFELTWTDGTVDRDLVRVDEPQVLVEDGRPTVLYLSIRSCHDGERPEELSYKVQLPITID